MKKIPNLNLIYSTSPKAVFLAIRSLAQSHIWRGNIWDMELHTPSTWITDSCLKHDMYHYTAHNVKSMHKPGSVTYRVSWPIFMIMKRCLWPNSSCYYFCWKWVIVLFSTDWGFGYATCRCLAVLFLFNKALRGLATWAQCIITASIYKSLPQQIQVRWNTDLC